MKAKETIDEIKTKLSEFVPVMDGLSRARNPYELKYFVVGKHDDRIQQYKQAVIEMDSKYKAVVEGIHGQKLRAIQRERLALKLKPSPIDRSEELDNEETNLEILKLDREEHDGRIAMTGAFKEVMDFIWIIEEYYPDLIDKSEEELLEKEPEYWDARLSKQITVDLLVIGRIGEGNLNVLLMLPKERQERILISAAMRKEETLRFQDGAARQAQIKLAQSYPNKTAFIAPPDYVPLKFLKDAPAGYPAEKVVHIDRAEIMLATLHRPGDKKWFSENFWIPTGKNYIKHSIECPNGDSIGEYRNRLVKDALSLGCTHIFFVDDDLVVEQGALQKLYAHDLDVVGFKYAKKTPIIECASMISEPGSESKMPVPMDATGLTEIDWSLTAGGTLIKMDVFKRLPYPWYMTIPQGTEDTYFCARLREAGIKCFIDNDIWADHVDKSNGDSYGKNGIEPGKYKHLL